MTIKKRLSSFWNLLWKDDSFKGWAFSVVFIFLFIKFIFFPFMSLVTGTALPLAIVESCSMYHDGGMFSDVDSWWESQESKYASFDIFLDEFKDFPMKKGFTKGDILFIVGTDPDNLNRGDVVIFDASQRNPVIHRIVGIREENGERIFSTIGDNNQQQLPFENSITGDNIVGRAVVQVVPYAGWMKLLMYEWKRPVAERGFCS
ncbi:MAG: signal peptidase I [Nanoarchaeota archaeon]|nr:signal peptidase I [Nanoarchaeota archaeon]